MSITLATARAAGSGTGDVFVPFNFAGDTAELRVDGSPYSKSIRMKRTQPAPSRTNSGVFRGEVTLTEYVADAAGVKWPVVYKVQTSIPAFMTITDAAAFAAKFGYVANDSWVIDALARQLIPQS